MSQPDIEEVIAAIRDRIADRRAKGDYPPGLENELEWEFQHLIESTNRRVVVSQVLVEQVRMLEEYLRVSGNVDEGTHRLKDIVTILTTVAGEAENADRRLVAELNQHVMDRIAVVDHLAILMTELERRVIRLEGDSGKHR